HQALFAYSYASPLSHPTSHLFPYTPLFRSPLYPVKEPLHPAIFPVPSDSFAETTLQIDARRPSPQLRERGAPPGPIRMVNLPHLDRKSTRLNSSHVKISYAVFCLKKKITHR